MNKKELESHVVKDHLQGSKNEVVGIRISVKTVEKLKAKGIDIHSTVRSLLDRLAE